MPVTIPQGRTPAAGAASAGAVIPADLLLGAGLVLAVLATYLPAIRGDFIWNDADYVTAPHLRPVEGLARIWTELGATEQYYPLLHSAFWLQHRLWGDAVVGYHLVSILSHATAAVLFALILRRLAVPGAWLAGFIFALHPVAVESVAWIAEQKNTQSALLGLLAIWWYLRSDSGRRRGPYLIASGIFLCALLSKTTTAVLPAAVLVLAWWRHGRLEWRRDWWPLLPWLIAGAALGLVSAWVEKRFVGADGPEFALEAAQRLLLAGRIPWFYLGQLLWPADLVFIYPRWELDVRSISQWLFPLTTGVVLLLLFIWRRRLRALFATALLFGGMLFPVIGFFNLYAFIYSFVADHWQYLPMLSPIALIAAGLAVSTRRWGAAARGGAAAAILLVLAILTARQSRMYANMETFYRTTIASNPACWMAHHNLGSLLRDRGRREEARFHYEQALATRPDSPKTLHNLAILAREEGDREGAIALDRRAVGLDPISAPAHDHLGLLLREAGRPAEALPHHEAAIRLDPRRPDSFNHYGMTLRELGRHQEAINQFEEALVRAPAMVPARLNLALTLTLLGREAEALAHYREARRLNPALPDLEQAPAR